MPQVDILIETDEGDEERTIDVEVWCAHCGAGLCNISDGSNCHRGSQRHAYRPSITVGICERCKEAIRVEAYDEGYAAGAEAEAAKEE